MPTGPDGQEMSEEELRAAYEAEMKQIRVEDVLIQTVVSLLNLGGRKAGLAPGTEDERDLDQVGVAIESARRLLPFVEELLGPDAKQLKDALSQLQMAYVRLGGGPVKGAEGTAPAEEAPSGGIATPPAAGRLWVPGS